MLITVMFTQAGGAPATGLTLADVDIYLVSRNKTTGALANLWNPQPPSQEIGGGLYGRDYGGIDLEHYDYFAWAQYTGAAVLDSNWSLMGSPTSLDAQSFWAYSSRSLTFSLADFHVAQNGTDIEIQRGDTLSLSLTYLGSLAGRAKLWFTVKDDKDHADAAADIQIEETVGLIYINKAAGTPANGSIVVTDAALGNLTITLAAVEAAKLATTGNFIYDLQMLAGGVVTTLRRGKARIVGDVTRAVV